MDDYADRRALLEERRKEILLAWEKAWVDKRYDEAGAFALLLRDMTEAATNEKGER